MLENDLPFDEKDEWSLQQIIDSKIDVVVEENYFPAKICSRIFIEVSTKY